MTLFKASVLVATIATLTVVAPATAHEMFLRPQSAFQPSESEQVVRLVNGTFDKSENSISRDRMADVRIVAGGAVTKPPAANWFDDATASSLKYRTGKAGTYVIGVSTRPKIIVMSPADFIAYLKHDGVLDTLAAFENDNKLTQVRERYSKHVRAIVQVGDSRTADYSTPLGHPVEILLDQNPYDLKFGKDVSFRVLFKGKPVANQLVRASYEGFHGHDASGGHINSYQLRTDQDGRATFLLNNKAAWYISLIHMQKITDPEADYESNWATVTFTVK
ncbi:MAG: DUF4198 domain-containing protein [Steroidobacteraceae bacterium]